eukprot:SAG25_NODE_2182_length_1865_cov_1.842016_2_plen_85_part_00
MRPTHPALRTAGRGAGGGGMSGIGAAGDEDRQRPHAVDRALHHHHHHHHHHHRRSVFCHRALAVAVGARGLRSYVSGRLLGRRA